jgi:hypothetical protein
MKAIIAITTAGLLEFNIITAALEMISIRVIWIAPTSTQYRVEDIAFTTVAHASEPPLLRLERDC